MALICFGYMIDFLNPKQRLLGPELIFILLKRNLDDGLHRDLISGTWTLSIAGHVMSVILPCGFVIMLIFLLAMCVNKEKE